MELASFAFLFPRVVFAADHAGVAMREVLSREICEVDIPIESFGARDGDTPVDYPVVVPPVIRRVKEGAAGVLICATGIGMSIAANRFRGIRAALCHDVAAAECARRHNNANIIVFGGQVMRASVARECLICFLKTPFEGGRHARRIALLDCFEDV